MPSLNLVPLSLGELLDQTFSYFRKHFWLFAGIMVAPEAILIAFNILMQIFLPAPAPVAGAGVPTQAQMAAYGTRFALGFLGIMIPYYVVYALALGATTHALSEIYLGRTTTIRDSYGAIRRRLGRIIKVIVTVLLYTLAFFVLAAIAFGFSLALIAAIPKPLAGIRIILGLILFLAFIITGVLMVLFLVRYSVAIPALVLENLSSRTALKRSIALTKGYFWRLLVVGVLMLLIRVVVVVLCQLPFTIAVMVLAKEGVHPTVWMTIPGVLVGGASAVATAPLVMIGFALAYYDLRVRKEGFDLQLMMADLDASGQQGATGPGRASKAEPLEDAGIFGMCLLTLLTAGLYQPIWFLRRRKALNSLHSREKLGVLPLLLALAALVASICLPTLGSIKFGSWVEAENAFPPLHPLILLVAGLIMIVQCFKVRRILLDHLAPRQEGMFSAGIRLQYEELFSRMGTFFFGIFYLQSKINGMLDRFVPGPGGQESVKAPAPSPLPVGPVIS